MEIFNKHPQWTDVKKICIKIREKGFTAWLAGGCVRDGLMGVIPHDFDVATNARPKKVESFFNRTVDVGKSFGVIRVIENSGSVEVATFRKDGIYVDGRHPVGVELATAPEDAQRRDFTINALFYDPFEGEVHDYVNGVNDIHAKIIRTVGVAADRFMEDRLRILRAVRFASQLNFTFEPATWLAVKQFATAVSELKYERIHDEINKLLRGARPDHGVSLLVEAGLMKVILPEFQWPSEKGARFFKQMVNEPDREDLGWLFVLTSAISLENQVQIGQRFKFSNEKKARLQNILDLVTSIKIFDRLNLADQKKVAADTDVNLAYKFTRLMSEPSGEDRDNLKVVENFLSTHGLLPTPFIGAQDLLDLGIQPGRQFGVLIAKAYDEQLDEKILSKSEALEWLRAQLKV